MNWLLYLKNFFKLVYVSQLFKNLTDSFEIRYSGVAFLHKHVKGLNLFLKMRIID